MLETRLSRLDHGLTLAIALESSIAAGKPDSKFDLTQYWFEPSNDVCRLGISGELAFQMAIST